MGEDVLVYGMSRQQMIFVFKFDPTKQKYVYLSRSFESTEPGKKNQSQSNVLNLNFNQFNLIDGFGVMDSPKEQFAQFYYITKNQSLYSATVQSVVEQGDTTSKISQKSLAMTNQSIMQQIASNMGLEITSNAVSTSQTHITKALKFTNQKEVYYLKGNRIIDFKLISVDKAILLFQKHLSVIDTTSQEQLLLYNSIFQGQP